MQSKKKSLMRENLFASNKIWTFILLLILSANSYADSRDKRDVYDHPLISRFPGSYIYDANHFDYDEFYIATSAASGKKMTTQKVVGNLSGIVYRLPNQITDLQAMANYTDALRRQGFKQLFYCVQEDCGKYFASKLFREINGNKYRTVELSNMHGSRRFRYWSGKLSRADGDIYVSLLALNKGGQSSWMQQHVVQVGDMQSGLIAVNSVKAPEVIYKPQPVQQAKPVQATQPVQQIQRVMPVQSQSMSAKFLAQELNHFGKAVLTGIEFEPRSDKLLAKSKATIKAVADFLNGDPKLNVYLVGHTDDRETELFNLDLSVARANAVIESLAYDFNIRQPRMIPIGMGPYSPVISNKDQTALQQNNRIELVLKTN